jgi:glycosyltransferase involved in cell wall biosynthesis
MPTDAARIKAVNVCLTHDPALAGLYRAVNDFALALDAPILSFDDGRRDRRSLAATEPCPVTRIPAGTGWLSRDCHVVTQAAAARAETALADAGLLVVHSLFRGHPTWSAGVAQRRQVRLWAVPHGCLDPWGLSQRRWLKRAWLAAYGLSYFSQAERVVFATRREAEKAARWIPAGRGTVVHWPVHLPEFSDREFRRQRFREQLGIDESERLLLSVGRLHSMKRPIETVAAFCAAAANDCHLAIVGMDGDIMATQVEAAVPAAFRQRVHVVGPLAGVELAAAYFAADGFVALSFRENFGYAVAEAIAYGLPVILSPGHDLAYDLPSRGGRLACGWLLPDDSSSAAEQAIEGFCSLSETEFETIREAGTAWARDNLSVERFSDTLRSLVDRGTDV